jgi:hypothetical protein
VASQEELSSVELISFGSELGSHGCLVNAVMDVQISGGGGGIPLPFQPLSASQIVFCCLEFVVW